MEVFLIMSGVAFWVVWIIIVGYWIYEKLDAEIFFWRNKRMWDKYYKKQFKK